MSRAAEIFVNPGIRQGRLDGNALGSDIRVLFVARDEVDKGPPWHDHPHDKIFIVRKGRARFKIGDTVIDAAQGDVPMGPQARRTRPATSAPDRVRTDLIDPDRI